MLEAVLGDVTGVGDSPQVAHLQAAPVQPADAPCVVAPGDTGAEGQLLSRVPVGPGPVDLAHHLDDPWPDRPGLGVLGMKELEELLGLGLDQLDVRIPGPSLGVGPADRMAGSRPDPSGTW
jgi:hypothetical protein